MKRGEARQVGGTGRVVLHPLGKEGDVAIANGGIIDDGNNFLCLSSVRRTVSTVRRERRGREVCIGYLGAAR
jgi:hypothetical protein